MFYTIDVNNYFQKEIDDRDIKDSFDLKLIPQVLAGVNVFTNEELQKLNALQDKYKQNISQLSKEAYAKELERLGGAGALRVQETNFQMAEIYLGLERVFKLGKRRRLRIGIYGVAADSNFAGPYGHL